MQDRFFIDTNLLIYYVANDASRKAVVRDLLIENDNIISSQVITEFIAVTLKKQILSFDDSVKYAKEFMELFHIGLIDKEVILSAFKIAEQYQYSIWDSLIIASALESDCTVLYTEDLQHGQIIEKKLKIINPFSV